MGGNRRWELEALLCFAAPGAGSASPIPSGQSRSALPAQPIRKRFSWAPLSPMARSRYCYSSPNFRTKRFPIPDWQQEALEWPLKNCHRRARGKRFVLRPGASALPMVRFSPPAPGGFGKRSASLFRSPIAELAIKGRRGEALRPGEIFSWLGILTQRSASTWPFGAVEALPGWAWGQKRSAPRGKRLSFIRRRARALLGGRCRRPGSGILINPTLFL